MNSNDGNSTSKKVALLVTTTTSFLNAYTMASVNIAFPAIGEEFKLDAVILGWVPTSFLLASAMFLVPFGRVADIYGRKKIYTYGVFVYTISSLIQGLSYSPLLFMVFRVVQGIGGAMIFGIGAAILTSVFPARERGKALGINVASVYIGLSLGPTLGGFLTQHLGWRSVFLVGVPLGIFIIGAVLWKLKGEWAEARGEKIDFVGSIVYALALMAIMYGFSLLPEMTGVCLIVAGIASACAFIWWELRVTSPVLNISLFKNNTAFALSSLAALINYSAIFASTFLLSLYLQYIKGFSPAHAGLILVVSPIVQAIASPFAGRLSDRIEPRIIASVGMAVTAVGLLLFIFVGENTHLAFIFCGLVILGLGLALFASPNMNAIMSSVEKRYYGVASGTVATMRITGQMLSMGIAMLFIALFVGRVQITPEYYPAFLRSMRADFIVFTALCFAGIFASLVGTKHEDDAQ